MRLILSRFKFKKCILAELLYDNPSSNLSIPLHSTTTTTEREQLLSKAMDEHGAFILNYLTKLCSDRHLAEEIAMQLWQYVYFEYELKQFTEIVMLKRKARFLFIDSLRKQKVRSHVQFVAETPDYRAEETSIETTSIEQERDLYLDFWLQYVSLDFTEQDKELFWLHVRMEFTMAELSQQFGIPTSTIHDRIRRVSKRCLKLHNDHVQ